MLEIYTHSSNNPGPNFLFLGSIHGNETCGSIAIDTLREKIISGEIHVTNGSVTFLPRVNKKAFEEGKRFIDINLNRVITENSNPTTQEEKIAQELITVIRETDYLIDLHSMTAKTVPIVFVDYTTKENIELADSTGITNFIYGWPSIYTDLERSKDTTHFANMHNIPGITIECGNHTDPESTKVALSSMLNILSHYSSIDTFRFEKTSENTSRYLIEKVYFKNSMNDILERNFKNFDFLSCGNVIAVRHNGETILAEHDGYIMLPNNSAQTGNEWFYFGIKIK